jgi:hypothetical protein
MLADVGVDVFGLFVQWIYGQGLANRYGQPSYQHRLMVLWVFAKRLQMPRLQNDSIYMLEERRGLGEAAQKKTLKYVWANTTAGDLIRRYLVDVCHHTVAEFSQEEIIEFFPIEMLEEIAKMDLMKLEKNKGSAEMDVATALRMETYHVEENGFGREDGSRSTKRKRSNLSSYILSGGSSCRIIIIYYGGITQT